MRERKLGLIDALALPVSTADGPEADPADAGPDGLLAHDDDILRLMFIACHPVVPMEGRVALTLKVLGGLSTAEIAKAFLVPEPTAAQRIVRAKRTLSAASIPFEMPSRDELDARLSSVLAVVYVIFNEGYSASRGDELVRRDLCDEALRLGRMLAALAADEPEAHGLAALMEIQASRLHARIGEAGEPVLLLEQDRTRWDQLLIRRGLSALDRARALGQPAGQYVLQAEIAACHARARERDDTDWARIAALYGVLAEVAPSPIVELNRAVAMSMVLGPATGIALLDALQSTPALSDYYLLPAARADMLSRLGRHDESSTEFARAAALTDNRRQREHLLGRAAQERS
jgi:predicted RNA polymerase sigma factor